LDRISDFSKTSTIGTSALTAKVSRFKKVYYYYCLLGFGDSPVTFEEVKEKLEKEELARRQGIFKVEDSEDG